MILVSTPHISTQRVGVHQLFGDDIDCGGLMAWAWGMHRVIDMLKPDGSEQEQITDDQFNNWFPHISPDGERMVILSYEPKIAADDHPWYKHVYLRLLTTMDTSLQSGHCAQ